MKKRKASISICFVLIFLFGFPLGVFSLFYADQQHKNREENISHSYQIDAEHVNSNPNDDNYNNSSTYVKEELENDSKAPSDNSDDYNENGEYVPHDGQSNNPEDYNYEGEYKPVDSMSNDEVKKELESMLERNN